MKARSESSSNNQAFHGRLNAMDGDGWCSSLPKSNGEWLQVDIGIPKGTKNGSLNADGSQLSNYLIPWMEQTGKITGM